LRGHRPPQKKPPEPANRLGYRYHDNQRCLCVQTKQVFQAYVGLKFMCISCQSDY
jgi:hypothetical protein